jgi:hypothetical protein
MKKLFWGLLLAFCVASGPLSAQKMISPGKSRLDVGKRKFNIVKVIDARFDSLHFGVARSGMSNNKERIVLDGPFEPTLERYFAERMAPQSGLPNVLLRVTRFGLWEEATTTNEGARVAADFEFYRLDGEGQRCALLGDRLYRHTEGLGMDVSKYHDDNFRMALQAALDYLQDSVDWAAVGEIPARHTLAQLQASVTPRFLTDSAPVAGAYKNFSDLRNNNPRLSARIEEEEGQPVLRIEHKPGKFRRVRPADRVWGFSDGQDVYINQWGQFFKLEHGPEGKLRFRGVDVEKRASNMATGGAFFGIIGAVVADLATDKDKTYEVDWNSGAFFPVEK